MAVTPKLKIDPGAEARKAAQKKAQERRAQMASARTEKVVETFARKRRQLARCKGEDEEKVKMAAEAVSGILVVVMMQC